MSENGDYDWNPFHEAISGYKSTTPWPTTQDEFEAYTQYLADIVLKEQERAATHELMKGVRI